MARLRKVLLCHGFKLYLKNCEKVWSRSAAQQTVLEEEGLAAGGGLGGRW